MGAKLQEELDNMVRADLEEGRPMRVRDMPLTPVRGKLLSLQRALFNKNWRNCWGAVQ